MMQYKNPTLDLIKSETEDSRKELSDQKFGNEIEKLRLAAGLSQDELGKLTGDRQSVIHRIEKAKYGVTLDLVFRLAVALRDDPHRLASIYWDSYSDKYSDENKRVLDAIWNLISAHYLHQDKTTNLTPQNQNRTLTTEQQAARLEQQASEIAEAYRVSDEMDVTEAQAKEKQAPQPIIHNQTENR